METVTENGVVIRMTYTYNEQESLMNPVQTDGKHFIIMTIMEICMARMRKLSDSTQANSHRQR